MSFTERITAIVTGKSKEERMRAKEEYKKVRQKETDAYYKAREVQAQRVAQARAKLEADRRISQFKQQTTARPTQGYSNPFGYSSFGGPQPQPRLKPRPRTNKKYREAYLRLKAQEAMELERARMRVRRGPRRPSRVQRAPMRPQAFNPFGTGSFGPQVGTGRYRVI